MLKVMKSKEFSGHPGRKQKNEFMPVVAKIYQK
jgi:hypothetical protein